MTARLFRLVDPFGAGVGFFTPLFRLPETNAPCTQVADGGKVRAFEPLLREDYSGIDVDDRSVELGDPIVWSFVFGPNDMMVGQGEDERARLGRRFTDAFFDGRPLLGVEAAEFVGDARARVRFAKRVYGHLSERSSVTAGTWRDLSMLTPDVIAALRALPEELLARGAPDLGRVVVMGGSKGLVVHGVDDTVPPQVIGPIIEQIEYAFAKLHDLYPEIAERPPITFLGATPERGPSPRPALKVDAVIRILDPRLEHLREALNAPYPSSFTVLAYPEHATQAAIEAHRPRGVFSVARLDCPVQGMQTGDVHFALRPSRAWSTKDRDLTQMLPGNSVVVDTPAIMDRRFGNGAEGVVRNAAAALTSLRERRDGLGFGDFAVYMQATGTGPRPELDAWCQLHARLSRLGLETAGGARFYTAGGREPDDLQRVIPALFPRVDLEEVVAGGANRRRAACGMIVEGRSAPPGEVHDHVRHATEAILVHRGWRIPDIGDPRGRGRTLFIQGDEGGFDCDTQGEIPPIQLGVVARDRREEFIGKPWLTEARPLQARRARVHEEADVNSIVGELAMNATLLVTLRDLALSNPALPPMVSLLSGQLRRFSSGLPSKARTHYLAMLVFAALTEGAVRYEDASQLEHLLLLGEIGRGLDLTCHSVSYSDDHTVATFRIAESGRFGREHVTLFQFKIVFARTGLLLFDAQEF